MSVGGDKSVSNSSEKTVKLLPGRQVPVGVVYTPSSATVSLSALDITDLLHSTKYRVTYDTELFVAYVHAWCSLTMIFNVGQWMFGPLFKMYSHVYIVIIIIICQSTVYICLVCECCELIICASTCSRHSVSYSLLEGLS